MAGGFRRRRVELVEVDDRVEQQRIGADGFAAPDRVIREQQHVAFAVARVHDRGAPTDPGSARGSDNLAAGPRFGVAVGTLRAIQGHALCLARH
jgi:hypothetical protein